MAISSSDVTALTVFSWTEIKTMAVNAIANSLLGGATLTKDGRTIMRCTLDEAKKIYEWADTMDQIGSDVTGGLHALVRFGEAQ